MSSTAVSKARKTTKKVGGPKKVATHPPVSEMVISSIRDLASRRGSSLTAIKKYIAATYNVDVDRLKPFIRRYIKAALQKGVLLQAKGAGAAGSFRMSAALKKGGTGRSTTAKPKAKSTKTMKKAKRPASPKKAAKSAKPAKKAKTATKSKAVSSRSAKPKPKARATVKKAAASKPSKSGSRTKKA